jgi:hypothetical protein
MMNPAATWTARLTFGLLTLVSSYAAVTAQLPAPQPVMQAPLAEEDVLKARVVALGDRLSNIEGKLDVMEKLDIGLIIAMGGQLLHLALAKRNRS